MKRAEAYVGISGVVNPVQHAQYVQEWKELHENRPATKLALGVKAVHKTQYEDTANKYGKDWYPVGGGLRGALDADEGSTLHIAQMYMEPEHIRADGARYMRSFIDTVKRRSISWLDALQFDKLPYVEGEARTWHDVLSYAKLAQDGLARSRHYRVVLQCYEEAMAAGPRAAVERVKECALDDEGTTVDYVLFDASHGTGKEMKPDILMRFLEAGYADTDLESAGVNFGVAGGLNAKRIQRHMPGILREFPDVSWDAEGQLHDAIPREGGTGILVPELVSGYLGASAHALYDTPRAMLQ